MFSRHNRMIGAFYLCADLLLALVSFWVAWEVRSYLITPRPLYSLSNYPWIVPLAVGIWISVGLLAGIYRDIKEEDLSRAFADPLKIGSWGRSCFLPPLMRSNFNISAACCWCSTRQRT